MAIWDILRPFGTICVHLVHFLRFWYHAPRKICQLWSCQFVLPYEQFYHLKNPALAPEPVRRLRRLRDAEVGLRREQVDAVDAQQDDELGAQELLRRPGIDSTKLLFGRKLFG
jgi:hypothetical protein